MEQHLRLANKYAQAVFNVFDSSMSRDDIASIEKIVIFLEQHKKALFFLKLSSIGMEVKKHALNALLSDLSNKKPCMALIQILLNDNRGHLLYHALRGLVDLYYKAYHIMPCHITSSHELSPTEFDNVKQFLARQTGDAIIYTYSRDTSLIAGIRVLSKTILWEHSIRKQLHELALNMAPKG